MRSTREVLDSHLGYRRAGDLEADLAVNYHDDVALLSWGEGTGRGKDEVRRRAEVLSSYLGEGAFSFEEVLVEGDVGMLRWTGKAPEVAVRDGIDSFVVHEGLIVAQTIYYSVHETGAGRHRG